MFKSPRRNGRNKGLKIKHVMQISLLLGVSVWLLYQIHHSDDKKSSAMIKVSRKSNNDSNKDINKLGRKVLRPKVNETKEQNQASDDQNNVNEESEDVEDHESDEHEDSEEIKEHENKKENDEENKGKLNGNTRNEGKRVAVNIEKDVSPSEDQTAQQIGFAPSSYLYETNTAKDVKPTEAQSKKDEVPVLEEEKDAFTEVETLPENVTGGSISLENAATE